MELVNCVFCGQKPYIIAPGLERLYRPGRNGHAVYCATCNIIHGWDFDYGGEFMKPEEAVKSWNKLMGGKK